LLENPLTSRVIVGLTPHAGLDAFATASGVDLRRVPSALIAAFDYGTLYMASLPTGTAAEVRARFSERLVAGAIDKEPYPGMRRISGVIGQTPETLLTLDERTLAVAVGDPTPSRIVEAFARGRLKSSPTALRGSALRDMPSFGDAPLVAFAPGPFPDDWQRAANGLLGSALAVGAGIEPVDPASIAITFILLGDFKADPERATSALAEAWQSLSQSSTGKLLGIDQGEPPRISAEQAGLRMVCVLPVEPLIHGLRAAILTDVSEILRLTPRAARPGALAPVP
jgi:hypothetical protein